MAVHLAYPEQKDGRCLTRHIRRVCKCSLETEHILRQQQPYLRPSAEREKGGLNTGFYSNGFEPERGHMDRPTTAQQVIDIIADEHKFKTFCYQIMTYEDSRPVFGLKYFGARLGTADCLFQKPARPG